MSLSFLILFVINIDSKNVWQIDAEDPSKLKYCLDRYNTQEMFSKAIDDFLPALKVVPECYKLQLTSCYE